VSDDGTAITVATPLNPDGDRPAIVTVCPATRPVAVGVVHVTIFDNTDATIVFEIVGLRLLPIKRLFDPVTPPPELAPSTMFCAPVAPTPVDAPRNTPLDPPAAFPPILTVLETFDRLDELDVPIHTQFVTFDIFEPAYAPPMKELTTLFPAFPHR
jgi:hypothetical protein